jgi:hypothetical protein
MSYSIAAAPDADATRGGGPGTGWENGPGGRLRVTPGRVAALALGIPVVLAMIGWTGFNVVALLGQSNYPVSLTIAPHDNQLTAQISADLTVRQSSQGNAAHLTGTAHYSLFKPPVNVDQTATSTSVNFDCHVPVGDCSLDASLVVPQGIDVSVSSLGSDMTIPEFTGNITLNTDGGTLSAGSLTGELQLTTSGGDLNATSLRETAGTSLQAKSDGGSINADSVVAASSDFESSGGDVNLTFTQVPRSLTINSDGGSVSLVLPRGPYSFSTSSDGGTLNGQPSTPGAQNSIMVDSSGGDINISYAN